MSDHDSPLRETGAAMRNINFIMTVTTLICGLVFSLPAEARIKCWTNNEGIRECGETVPPEFAQKGHQEISAAGVVVEEQERAKTKEELDAEAVAAAAAAEEQRKLAEKKRQDQILLATFSSVQDIERILDEQLSALDATIAVTKTRSEKIDGDLDKRIKAAAAEERAGKRPNEALLQDIESLRRQLKNNEKYIADKQQEKEAIRLEYAKRIERFKELRALNN